MFLCTRLQAYVSVKRINKFMNLEELDPNNVQHDPSERKCKIYFFKAISLCIMHIIRLQYTFYHIDLAHALVIDNGSFCWDSEEIERPILRNINLHVEQGQLVAIVGTVGSGKSSLLSALLGEMDKLSGKVNTKVSILSLNLRNTKYRSRIYIYFIIRTMIKLKVKKKKSLTSHIYISNLLLKEN